LGFLKSLLTLELGHKVLGGHWVGGRFGDLGLEMLLILEMGEYRIQLLLGLRPLRSHLLELLDRLIILRILGKLIVSLLLRLLESVHRVPESLHVVRGLVLSGLLLRAHLSPMLFLCQLESRFVDLLFCLLAEIRLQFEVLGG